MVPVLFSNVQSGLFGLDWGALQAGVTVAVIPSALIFSLLQRYYLQSLMGGAVNVQVIYSFSERRGRDREMKLIPEVQETLNETKASLSGYKRRHFMAKIVDAIVLGLLLCVLLPAVWLTSTMPELHTVLIRSATDRSVLSSHESDGSVEIRETSAFTTPLVFAAVGEKRGDGYAIALDSAGDIDGDGSADFIVGAYGYPDMDYKGKVYLYRGGMGGLDATAAYTLIGESPGDRFGSAVAGAGDVNNDGFDDIIVSAAGYPGGAGKGKVYIYFGKAGGLNSSPAITFVGDADGSGLGWKVGTAGDVNKDGFADVLVVARAYPPGKQSGQVYVYHGGPSGDVTPPAFVVTGEADGDVFGWAAGTAGDVNGDGYDDVIIGAYGHQGYKGKVYIYHGSVDGLSAIPSRVLYGENTLDMFGHSLGTAGDVDGDGFDDIIIGAYSDPEDADPGSHHVYLRGADSGIHELWWSNGQWTHQNLSQLAGNTPAAAGDPSSYVTPGTGSHHIYFRGVDSGIHELWWNDGQWTHQNLSQLAGNTPAAAGDPSSYVTPGTGSHHIYFRGVDSSIHELWWSNGQWTHQNLSQLAGNTPAAAGDPSSYVTPGTGSHHIYFRGADSDIHELWWSNGQWTHQNLSQLAGNTPAAAGDPSGYVTPGTGSHHIYFRGVDSSIHELWWNNGQWTHQNLSQLAGNTPAAAGDPSSYATPGTGSHHIYFRGADSSIHELWWNDGQWTHQNLSQLAGNTPAAAGDPSGYVTPGTGSHHIYFRGVDSSIHELWWNDGQWTHQNLSQLAGNTPAAAGDLSGYTTPSNGRAYVYHGSASGIGSTPTLMLTGQTDSYGYAREVSSAGDIDGDGFADIIVGELAGKVHLYRGSQEGLITPSIFTIRDENSGDDFGFSLASAGDVNADGTDEFAVGAYRFPEGGSVGKAYVYAVKALEHCFSLTLSHTGFGSNPIATPVKSANCPAGTYMIGERISVEAKSDAGWTLRSWGGTDNNASRNDTNSLTMPPNDHTVNVSYQQLTVEGGQFEPNNNCGDANSIVPNGTPQNHSIHRLADTDWVRFDGKAGSQYLIEVTVPAVSPADVALEVYIACDSGAITHQDFSFSPGVRLQFTAPTSGPIFLKLLNNNPETAGNNVSYNLSVREYGKTVSPGILILVAGSLRDDDPLLPNIYQVTDSVYQLFVDNGFTDDRIFYLAPDLDHKASGQTTSKVDAISSKANLKVAITQWAIRELGGSKALTIYMMDHGDKELFFLDKLRQEWVEPQNIDEWLSELEEQVPGLKVNVIVEACYSGTFISDPNTLAGPNRVIISSTDDANLAWASEKGAQFSDQFISAVTRGQSLYASFQEAKTASAASNPSQQAWIDGDGDAKPLGSGDQYAADQRGFTFAGTFPVGIDSWEPYIVAVEQPVVIDNGRVLLRATVPDDIAVDQVYTLIYPPSYQAPEASEALVQESLNTVNLLDQGEDVYEAYYDGFSERGDYRVVFHAKDGQGRSARPVSILLSTGADVYLPQIVR